MMPIVATALSSNPGTTPDEVITMLGYSSPGDGGGGIFYWSAMASDPEDGGMVFGTGSQGRWCRLWSGLVNVRWFGAKGDGLGYDHSHEHAIGDTCRIQKAIDFCAGQLSGGTVFFPPGIYIVSSPTKGDPFKLHLKSKVNLLGCGSASQLHSALDQNYSSRTLVSQPGTVLEDVAIESLLIDGQESQQKHEPHHNVERTAIFVYESKGLRIANCVFQNTGDAIRLHGADQKSQDKDSTCVGARVMGNEIRNTGVDIGRDCIVIDGAYVSIIENNYIHDCPHSVAITMEGAPPGIEFSNVVHGNVCKNVGAGIRVWGGCIVSDNIFEAVANQSARIGHHCHFTGNRILSALNAGILLEAGNRTTEDVIIAHNTISNVHGASGTTCDGIIAEFHVNDAGLWIQPRNITISNNSIDNSMADPGIAFNGVRLRSSGSRIIVDQNQILGADAGIRLAVESNSRTRYFCAANNIFTLKKSGVGIVLSSKANQHSYLEHVIVSGNLVDKMEPGITGSTGIRIEGDPSALIVTGNDTSGTDTPFEAVGGLGMPFVQANNIGF